MSFMPQRNMPNPLSFFALVLLLQSETVIIACLAIIFKRNCATPSKIGLVFGMATIQEFFLFLFQEIIIEVIISCYIFSCYKSQKFVFIQNVPYRLSKLSFCILELISIDLYDRVQNFPFLHINMHLRPSFDYSSLVYFFWNASINFDFSLTKRYYHILLRILDFFILFSQLCDVLLIQLSRQKLQFLYIGQRLLRLFLQALGLLQIHFAGFEQSLTGWERREGSVLLSKQGYFLFVADEGRGEQERRVELFIFLFGLMQNSSMRGLLFTILILHSEFAYYKQYSQNKFYFSSQHSQSVMK